MKLALLLDAAMNRDFKIYSGSAGFHRKAPRFHITLRSVVSIIHSLSNQSRREYLQPCIVLSPIHLSAPVWQWRSLLGPVCSWSYPMTWKLRFNIKLVTIKHQSTYLTGVRGLNWCRLTWTEKHSERSKMGGRKVLEWHEFGQLRPRYSSTREANDENFKKTNCHELCFCFDLIWGEEKKWLSSFLIERLDRWLRELFETKQKKI